MRIRSLVVVALVLPVALSAQIRPRIGSRGPNPRNPAPVPPQPAPVARQLAYTRSRVAFETYPLLSLSEGPTSVAQGQRLAPSWSGFGAGTRIAYRLTPNYAMTIDLTGPAFADLGVPL